MMIVILTANFGSDYNAVTMNVIFPTNTMDGDMACVDISTFNDLFLEGNETFTVTTTLVASPVSLEIGQTQVIILDEESKNK